jgi:uracil-DNA glycosylase
MSDCYKCENYGLHFQRNYQPEEFLEGKKGSRVWIVGLNPAKEPLGTIEELEKKFDNLTADDSYFKKFKSVSKLLFDNLGKELGTAHTDIVKCSRSTFLKGKEAEVVIRNCQGFLETQIKNYKPAVIVCNGTAVSKFMLSFLLPPSDYTKEQTSYWSKIDGVNVCVVLSGYIGRIDNFSRSRLGVEIEQRLLEAQSAQT